MHGSHGKNNILCEMIRNRRLSKCNINGAWWNLIFDIWLATSDLRFNVPQCSLLLFPPPSPPPPSPPSLSLSLSLSLLVCLFFCLVNTYARCNGLHVCFPSLPPMLLCAFVSRLGLESLDCSMWHFLKVVDRGFLRVLRFPPLLHRFNGSAN